MKTYGVVDVELHSFLILTLDEVSGQLHSPAASPGERAPGIYWTGGWVDPTARLELEAKRKILCPCRESNAGRPARSRSVLLL
jgi:hypothetical protein